MRIRNPYFLLYFHFDFPLYARFQGVNVEVVELEGQWLRGTRTEHQDIDEAYKKGNVYVINNAGVADVASEIRT